MVNVWFVDSIRVYAQVYLKNFGLSDCLIVFTLLLLYMYNCLCLKVFKLLEF